MTAKKSSTPHAYQPSGGGDKAHGEDHGRAKMTEDGVREARRLFMTGMVTVVDLAAVLGVTVPTLSKALRGETWSHIQNPPPIPHRSDRKNLDLRLAAGVFDLTKPEKKKG